MEQHPSTSHPRPVRPQNAASSSNRGIPITDSAIPTHNSDVASAQDDRSSSAPMKSAADKEFEQIMQQVDNRHSHRRVRYPSVEEIEIPTHLRHKDPLACQDFAFADFEYPHQMDNDNDFLLSRQPYGFLFMPARKQSSQTHESGSENLTKKAQSESDHNNESLPLNDLPSSESRVLRPTEAIEYLKERFEILEQLIKEDEFDIIPDMVTMAKGAYDIDFGVAMSGFTVWADDTSIERKLSLCAWLCADSGLPVRLQPIYIWLDFLSSRGSSPAPEDEGTSKEKGKGKESESTNQATTSSSSSTPASTSQGSGSGSASAHSSGKPNPKKPSDPEEDDEEDPDGAPPPSSPPPTSSASDDEGTTHLSEVKFMEKDQVQLAHIDIRVRGGVIREKGLNFIKTSNSIAIKSFGARDIIKVFLRDCLHSPDFKVNALIKLSLQR